MAHKRTDLAYIIVKGRAHFTRAAYACVITQSTRTDERAIFHVETFYGNNGVKTRAEARRWGSAIVKGESIRTLRCQYLPVGFPSAGLPKAEREF